jgi:hypothetical protein
MSRALVAALAAGRLAGWSCDSEASAEGRLKRLRRKSFIAEAMSWNNTKSEVELVRSPLQMRCIIMPSSINHAGRRRRIRSQPF